MELNKEYSTLTDFKVFRGSTAEIESLTTVDMAWYLNYETGTILIGSPNGDKVPFGNSNIILTELIEKYNLLAIEYLKLREDFESLQKTTDDVITMKSQIALLEEKINKK